MSFNVNGFSKVSTSYNSANGRDFYTYTTFDDTFLDISVAGYFNDVRSRLTKGCPILIEDSSGATSFVRIITVIPDVTFSVVSFGDSILSGQSVPIGEDSVFGTQYIYRNFKTNALPNNGVVEELFLPAATENVDLSKPMGVLFNSVGPAPTFVTFTLPYDNGVGQWLDAKLNFIGNDVFVRWETNSDLSLYTGWTTATFYKN